MLFPDSNEFQNCVGFARSAFVNRTLTACLLAGTFVAPAFAQTLTPGQQKYRALFQELVETNTQLSNGDCTALAQKIARHLKEGGFPDSDIHVFTDPEAKAVLLLGHLDVVEARREDWTRDPFKLIEENGYFYGRGVSDMKSLAADWVDTMMRLKQEGFKPPRTLKMALTCGEETASAFNGANWLATHERALIDAEFALNEGGGGRLDKDGKPLIMTVQAAEKFPQDYTLEVTNPGGHSARPVPKNAINQLAAGLHLRCVGHLWRSRWRRRAWTEREETNQFGLSRSRLRLRPGQNSSE
jgi:acetylornithine deacetylase/succinyl-diaminopimelate desuccinylase-like protein